MLSVLFHAEPQSRREAKKFFHAEPQSRREAKKFFHAESRSRRENIDIASHRLRLQSSVSSSLLKSGLQKFSEHSVLIDSLKTQRGKEFFSRKGAKSQSSSRVEFNAEFREVAQATEYIKLIHLCDLCEFSAFLR
jgi:hypothetical protein